MKKMLLCLLVSSSFSANSADNNNNFSFFPTLKKISDVENRVYQGDWIFINFDKIIMYGNNFEENNLSNAWIPDPQISSMFRFFKEKSAHLSHPIRIIGSTSQPVESKEKIIQHLKNFNLEFDDIVFHSFKEESAVHNQSRVARAFWETIKTLTEKEGVLPPKRVLYIDHSSKRLIDVYENFTLSNTPLKVFLKQSKSKLYGNDNFPGDILDLRVIGHISGGSGGIHKLEDKNGQVYTLKALSNPDQMKEEILSDALYQALGVPVPDFAVYDHLPKSLKNHVSACGPYRLAKFIPFDAEQENIKDLLLKKMQKHFVVDAFLSNWDIVAGNFKNVILGQDETLWRIDNGGALRYRARGSLKKLVKTWDPHQVLELKTLRDININEDGYKVYGTITDEEISQQAHEIIKKSSVLWKTIDDLHQSIHLENPSEIKEMIYCRLQDLVKKFGVPKGSHDSVHSSLPNRYLKAHKNSAAGIFVYSIDPETKEPVVLLGKRRNHRWWANFGGKSDVTGKNVDIYLSETAAREVLEESMGLFRFTSFELDQFPFVDSLSQDGALFRMFVGKHAYVPLEKFNEKLKIVQDRHQQEHTNFRWVPLKDLMSALHQPPVVEENRNTIQIDNVDPIILYAPLYEILLKEGAQDMVQKICFEEKIPAVKNRVFYEHSTESGSLVSKRFYKNGYDYIQHDQQVIERQIVSSILRHINVINTIKKKEEIRSNNENILVLPKLSYTQTEAHYAMITQKDPRNMQENEVVVDYLQNYAQFDDMKSSVNDEYYAQSLAEMLKAERQNSEKYVFYHGAEPQISFYIDVISAFRSCFKLLSPNDLTIFRGLDTYFSEFSDIQTFMDAFKDENGQIFNYMGNYQQVGLSVNPFLFSADGNETSSTYKLFFKSGSAYNARNDKKKKNFTPPPSFQSLLKSFLSSLGVNSNLDRYQSLYDHYFKQLFNPRIFQIFIAPDVVDQVAYSAVSGGRVWDFNFEETTYHGAQKIMELIRNNPSDFEGISENSFNFKGRKSIHDLQYRLFMKPEIFHNPDLVQIKSYFRFPLSKNEQKSYLDDLHKIVLQDLVEQLQNKKKVDSRHFYEGTPKLNQLHKAVYEKVMDLPYTLKENSDFSIVVEPENQEIMENLMLQCPHFFSKKVILANGQVVYFIKEENLNDLKKMGEKIEEILFPLAVQQKDIQIIEAFLEKYPTIPCANIPFFNDEDNKLTHQDLFSYIFNTYEWADIVNVLNMIKEKDFKGKISAFLTKTSILKQAYPLHRAVENQDIDNVLFLLSCFQSYYSDKSLNFPDSAGRLPIFYAMEKNDIEIAQALIFHGLDPNIKIDEKKNTLLHSARDRHVDFARFLIDNGANVEEKNAYRAPPLSSAVYHLRIEMIKMLIDKGASVGFYSHHNGTFLHVLSEKLRTNPQDFDKAIEAMALILKKDPKLIEKKHKGSYFLSKSDQNNAEFMEKVFEKFLEFGIVLQVKNNKMHVSLIDF